MTYARQLPGGAAVNGSAGVPSRTARVRLHDETIARMRLIGYAVRRQRFSTKGVYLPLGDLTVLLGANDAGKSTVLRALASDLGGRSADSIANEGGALYFRAETSEVALLSDVRPASNRDLFASWSHGGYKSSHALEREDGENTVDAHLRLLREAATSEGFGVVIDQLASSDLICMDRVDAGLGKGLWRVYWCLPAFSELDPQVQDALNRSELHRFERLRAEAAGEAFRRPGLFGPVGPHWLEVDGAPVAIGPLGTSSLPMPRALAVPADSRELRKTVVDSLINLVNVTRWGAQDAWRNHELEPDDMAARQGLKVMLESAGEASVRPARAAVGALRLLTAAANASLPEFVSGLTVFEWPFRESSAGWTTRPLIVRVQPAGDAGSASAFDIDNVAEGLKLWLQLALLGGVALLDELTVELSNLADEEAHREQDALQFDDVDTSIEPDHTFGEV